MCDLPQYLMLLCHYVASRDVFVFLPHASKVLFLTLSLTFCFCFCLCLKYLRNRQTDLRQIHMADVFGPSLGRV